MTDEEFIAELEACILPESHFDHAAHVRAAYWYLRRYPFPDAAARMCATLRNYTRALGRAARYHETITIGFMAVILDHLRRRGDGGGWAGFRAENPQLLRKDLLLDYYPKAVLASAEARERFILLPLNR
jgi:hypothetical protein